MPASGDAGGARKGPLPARSAAPGGGRGTGGGPPGHLHPRSVLACLHGTKTLTTWRRGDPVGAPVQDYPFRCRSWRCPDCRGWVASVDYARLAHALFARERWVYVVLTLPAEARRLSTWDQYRESSRAWHDDLRRAIRRRWGAFEYVQTWEAHASGSPHCNAVLTGPGIIDAFDRAGTTARGAPGWRREWLALARSNGFGRVGWVQGLWSPRPGAERPRAGLASYMVKLSLSLGVPVQRGAKLAAEMAYHAAKGDQTPTAAPLGWRRLRASRGTLPPRFRAEGERTGAIHAATDPAWTPERCAVQEHFRAVGARAREDYSLARDRLLAERSKRAQRFALLVRHAYPGTLEALEATALPVPDP